MTTRSRLVMVVLLMVGGAARADDGAPASVPCKVLVLDLQSRALSAEDRELLPLLGEAMASEIGAVSGCEVIAESEIKSMLNYEKSKAICTTDGDSCLAEIGEAYGADRVVAGSLGRLGADLVLAVRLMNVRKGVVEGRAEETVRQDRAALLRAAKNGARTLMGAPPLAPEPVQTGSPAMFWAGAVTAGVGAAALVAGGVVTGIAEAQLATRDNLEKDSTQALGRAALVTAAAGVGVGVVGAVLIAWGLE